MDATRKAIAMRVSRQCTNMPGSTFYNAAEQAIEAMDALNADPLRAPVLPSEKTPTTIRAVAAEWGHELDDDEANAAADAWNACRAAIMQAGNSPVIPDGWKLVPVIALPSQWAAGQKAFDSAGINKVDAVYKAMVAAAPKQRER